MEGKPSFEEEVTAKVRDIDGKPLIFSIERVNPSSWFDLRRTMRRNGSAMPPMPQMIPLVYSALENKNIVDTARRVVGEIRSVCLVGHTARLWGEEGLFVQDYPLVTGETIVMDEKMLRTPLKKSEDGIYRSRDGLVRFAPYGFTVGEQLALGFERNTGLIATVGNKANAYMVAVASQNNYKSNPSFNSPFESVIDVPGILAGDLDVGFRIDSCKPLSVFRSFRMRMMAEAKQ